MPLTHETAPCIITKMAETGEFTNFDALLNAPIPPRNPVNPLRAGRRLYLYVPVATGSYRYSCTGFRLSLKPHASTMRVVNVILNELCASHPVGRE